MQHEALQILPVTNLQSGHGIKTVPFYSVRRKALMVGNPLIRPALCRQYGNSELGGGKGVHHVVDSIRGPTGEERMEP